MVKTYGWGALPDALNTGRRKEVKRLTGNTWVPVLVTDDDSVDQRVEGDRRLGAGASRRSGHRSGVATSVCAGASAATLRTTASTSSARRGPSASDTGVAWMRTMTLSAYDLLERDVGVVARRHADLAREQLLELARQHALAQPREHVDARRVCAAARSSR